LVRNTFKKSAMLERPLHCRLDIYVHPRMWVFCRMSANAVSPALRKRISKCTTALKLVADTAIEVVLLARIDPEGHQAHFKNVIHQLGDGAVNSLHHCGKVLPKFEIS